MAARPRMVVSVLALAGSLVVLVAGFGSAVAHSAKTGQGEVVSQTPETTNVVEQKEPPPSGGPMEVFADIERGWSTRNIDLILRHFGSQKVAISISGGPSGGTFSRNQSYYLLKDLFRYTATKKFEFMQYRKPGDEGRDTFAIAERQYRKTDDGRLFTDKVYVSLHLEHNDDDQERWVVDEIKSIR